MGGAFLMSGALAIAGALLPWLTLYAGLYRYNGMIGLNGRIVFAAGIAMTAVGVVMFRARTVWPVRLALTLAAVLLAFSAWLYVGQQQILHRPESLMVVARAGPGLLVIIAGAALMGLASVTYLLTQKQEVDLT